MVEAVVFDVDGVLVQSEELWDGARRAVADERGVPWPPRATAAMMGMSSAEWARYMHDEVGVPLPPGEIGAAVLARLLARLDRAADARGGRGARGGALSVRPWPARRGACGPGGSGPVPGDPLGFCL